MIWCIKSTLILVFNFDITMYIDYTILSGLALLADFLKDFMLLFKSHFIPMICTGTHDKTLSEKLEQLNTTHVHMSNPNDNLGNRPTSASSQQGNVSEGSQSGNDSNSSEHSRYTAARVEQLKSDYERLVDNIDRWNRGETHDRDGNPINRQETIENAVYTQQSLEADREHDFVQNVSGGRSELFRLESNFRLAAYMSNAHREVVYESEIVPPTDSRTNSNESSQIGESENSQTDSNENLQTNDNENSQVNENSAESNENSTDSKPN